MVTKKLRAPLFIIVVFVLAQHLAQAMQPMAASDTTAHTRTWEVSVDVGLPLEREARYFSGEWIPEYSFRIGIGAPVEKAISFHLSIEYDKWHSTTRWGDMTARVFDRNYPRDDVGAYVSLVGGRCLVLGFGGIFQLSLYLNTGPFSNLLLRAGLAAAL